MVEEIQKVKTAANFKSYDGIGVKFEMEASADVNGPNAPMENAENGASSTHYWRLQRTRTFERTPGGSQTWRIPSAWSAVTTTSTGSAYPESPAKGTGQKRPASSKQGPFLEA